MSAAYEDLFPYYAEICALSELRKKPGFGPPLASGVGGHALLYLNGARLDRTAGYPVLRLCTAAESPGGDGVGISVNSHYRNANWVAVEGRDFVWHGTLPPGEKLTHAAYEHTQATARAMGFLDGVEFHEEFFKDQPAGTSKRDFMYEISIATDYAVQFGRDVYRARIPLDRPRMSAIIDYLNALNAPYRAGQKFYHWRLFNDNCVHVAHNALAQAGVWAPWPTGQSPLLAAWRFPVPKNAFVDLIHRANELPLEDAQAIYEDQAARQSLLAHGTLPAAPGALARIDRAVADNDVYDTDPLRLIFFDNFAWGPYRHRFKQIFEARHNTDLHANLAHFAKRYADAQAQPRRRHAGARNMFQDRYEQYIAQAAARTRAHLTWLEGTA